MNNVDSCILKICKNEYQYFFEKANVQGVGLAYKVINGCTTNIICICVMVSKKIDKCYLTANNLIPAFYKGIMTDIVETGEFNMLALDKRIRPVFGGYSIGPSGILTSGSYGGLVKDNNGIYVLSNNHVLAVANLVPLGNPILQPSAEDGGSSTHDIIARLDRFVPVRGRRAEIFPENSVDCAIAKVTDPSLVSSQFAFIGTPKGVMAPALGMKLQMACAVSEYINGSIKTLGASIKVKFNKRRYLFINQIRVDHGAKEGDSGALALTADRYAVGLLFAGNDKEIFCNPIDLVLQGLNVTLVTE